MKNDEVREFFEQWDLYQKVISNNYMQHEEIGLVLSEIIIDRKNSSLLDVGCDGADIVVKFLKTSSVNRYCGIDLSEFALRVAKDRMNSLVDMSKFIQGVLGKKWKAWKKVTNILWSAFHFITFLMMRRLGFLN